MSELVSKITLEEWVLACRGGDRRAASRLITSLESGDAAVAQAASEAVAILPPPRHTIGITGPPGEGKLTLEEYQTGLLCQRGESVAVLAVDPSSPFTGGALLGDRIRMASHRNDSGVFVRSMGSRGAAGGLALAAADSLRVLAAAGYGTALVETVGAGQSEIDIGHLADTVCVVQVPGLGDDVQLMKMGQLEIADVFVVNKADKPGAEDLKIQIEQTLQCVDGLRCRSLRQIDAAQRARYGGSDWTPPVLLVSALSGKNGEGVLDAWSAHLAFVRNPALAGLVQEARIRQELLWRAGARFQRELGERLKNGDLANYVADIAAGKLNPLDAVRQALKTGR